MTKALARVQKQEELGIDAFNIAQVASFCSERLRTATDDLVTSYLTMGKRLADLRGKLKKMTPRGDNEHIGWVEAFKQKRPDGQPLFPFQRVTADKYISAYEFFDATALTPKIHKQLPSSLGALMQIIAFKFTRAQLEKAIDDKLLNTFSGASDVRNLAQKLGLVIKEVQVKTKPKESKRERIAKAFEILAKLDLTLDDLIEETGGKK